MKKSENSKTEDQSSTSPSPERETEEATESAPGTPTPTPPRNSTEQQHPGKKSPTAMPSSEHINATSRKSIKSGVRLSAGTLGLVFALTLATWIVFYSGLPLDAAGTAVVAGGWLVIVLAGQWIYQWARTASRRKGR